MKTHYEVEIVRVLKNSPFNCSGYIPDVICNNRNEVINLPIVQKLIDKTFGKHLIVNISSIDKNTFYQYEIKKTKAILS